MARRCPTKRLNSALLPTLGRPTIATVAGRMRSEAEPSRPRAPRSSSSPSATSSYVESDMVTSCLRRKAEVDMFRRIAAVAACAALFVLLGAVPTGALYVTTLPSSVDVWVDGTYVGHSPLVLDALAAGRHTVSLTKTGWQSQDLEVSVVAGVTSLSSVQMARAPSRSRAGS